MTAATTYGNLNPIEDCYIQIGNEKITLNNLPDISDAKYAVYNNEAIIGRSFPLYTYSHSADRTITMQLHFFVTQPSDVASNLNNLRLLQSAVYPREGTEGGAPFVPPVVCRLRCGDLLDTGDLCCVLQSYSVKFPTEVAWETSESQSFTPFRFDVDTQWLTVYTSSKLPYASDIRNKRIVQSSR